jgi:hypothetical protein
VKNTLGLLGFGALLCVPCLLVLVAGSGVISGSALAAFTDNGFAQGFGVLLALAGAAAGARYLRRRRQGCEQCELDRAQGSNRVSHHESHA